MKKPKKSVKEAPTKPAKKIALIRVRGSVNVRGDIEETLKLMNLNQSNHCVIVDDRPQYKGMIKKVKDYITWGEINQDMLAQLIKTRALLRGRIPLTDDYLKEHTSYKSINDFSKAVFDLKAFIKDVPQIKPVFRLKPPNKGFERSGIKRPYSLGGALGYRGEKINDLLARMI
ncbi:MAG: 50S ribosomal protein L30 [Candidatus Altiarchaeota archaeon]